ncbi:MAG: trehalose-phosphatase [bacterium]
MAKYAFDCVVFDLDGVITQTARVHAHAWKETFDQYMRMREKRDKESFKEFTHEGDYLPYVDGKPRYEGVKSFLDSRGINISYGEPSDTPEKETVCGLGNRKNQLFNDILKKEGADVYESSIDFIKELKTAGIKVAVASSSKNCKAILERAGFEDLFETRIDGVNSVELGLKGKPEGDIFVKAAKNLGAEPAESVVVEDATSGVAAGRNGAFGLVLGVARENNEQELLANGADVVVRDLAHISIDFVNEWFKRTPRLLLDSWEKEEKQEEGDILINPSFGRSAREALLGKSRKVFFLDYDGTLTPIVSRPELAVMNEEMRNVVRELSKKHMVAIVSGRMREDVENLVGIKELLYAGSHGFDIKGPDFSLVEPRVKDIIPVIDDVIKYLKDKLKGLEGVLIEEKKFSVAVHYRLANEKDLPQIKSVVDDVIASHKELRLMSGKKVFEILPDIDWDKGRAIRWIMEALNLSFGDVCVTYIGDDVTDEYAFRAVRTRGCAVLVSDTKRASAADFRLSSPDEVKKLFQDIIKIS